MEKVNKNNLKKDLKGIYKVKETNIKKMYEYLKKINK